VPFNAKCSTTRKERNNASIQDTIPISLKILFANWEALQGSNFFLGLHLALTTKMARRF
jgi:hypothetical protein